jgi:hypothetical protein
MPDSTVPALPPSQGPPSAPPQGVNLVDIINVLADKADPVVKLLQATVTSYQNGQEREIKFHKHMSLIAILLIAFIVAVAAALTWKGKIDGSTFTFLLGLIVGYVLTFVRDQITGSKS